MTSKMDLHEPMRDGVRLNAIRLQNNMPGKLTGTGVRLFANGGGVKVLSVKAWRLAPANPY